MSLNDIGYVVGGIPRRGVSIRDQRKYLMDALGKYNVKVIFNPKNGIVLLSTFNVNNISNECRKYAGYILDLNAGMPALMDNGEYVQSYMTPHPKIIGVLPIPPSRHIKYIDESKISRIVPVSDGTTVTMYWYNNEWVYATFSIYNFGQLHWCGSVTHGDIIAELFKTRGFDIDKLDTSRCYTIGYKCRTHPFYEGSGNHIDRLWLVQSADLLGINKYIISNDVQSDESKWLSNYIKYDSDIGIPTQTPINIQQRDIIRITRNAYSTYLKTRSINYGYIITYMNGNTYVVESDLYKYIRNMFYNSYIPGTKSDKSSTTIVMYPSDRQKYCVLSASLSYQYSKVIQTMFPQYDSEVDNITKKISDIHSVFTHALKNNTSVTCKEYAKLWSLVYSRVGTYSKSRIDEQVSLELSSADNTYLIYNIIYQ